MGELMHNPKVAVAVYDSVRRELASQVYDGSRALAAQEAASGRVDQAAHRNLSVLKAELSIAEKRTQTAAQAVKSTTGLEAVRGRAAR